HLRAIGRPQWLRAAGRVDDRQALVDQDRAVVVMDAAPVRAAVALALRQFQRLPAQGRDVVAGLQPEDAEDRTHGRNALVGMKGRAWSRYEKKPASCDAGFCVPGD